MKNSFVVKFPSVSENEGFARMCISAFLLPADPGVNELMDIKTAVSEGVTNAIIHGYEGKSDGIVTLSASLDNNSVYIEIIDEGTGIDNIEMARKPLFTTKQPLERAGMGFTIMEAFMDNITVSSELGKGTKVTMTRMLKNGNNRTD